MKWTQTYQKAVTFSYDDGVMQDARLIEILNRYGLKATFNINTGIGKGEGIFVKNDIVIDRFNLEELKPLYAGHEVAVHTLTHPHLPGLTREEMIHQLEGDRQKIESVFGNPVQGMAYPFGTYNDEVVEVLHELNFKYARTVESNHEFEVQTDLLRLKPTCHHNDPMLPVLIEKFISTPADTPQIIYIWGHSYEFDVDNNWEYFEEICKKIAGHADIFYGTNTEVLI